MREILFRAKAVSYGEWVYGNLIHSKRFAGKLNEWRIYEQETGLESDIEPETVGQFTGLLDKNGNKIFEGDILDTGEFGNYNIAIDWNEKACCHDWYILVDNEKQGDLLFKAIEESIDKIDRPFSDVIAIVGNIHDNPELL